MSLPDTKDEQAPIAGLDPRALWTVSNAFSALRVVLVFPTLYCLWLGPDYRWHVFWIVIAMGLSDILDGALARARDEVTEWGKIIDPVADNNWRIAPLPPAVVVTFVSAPQAAKSIPKGLRVKPLGDAPGGFSKFELEVGV